LHDWEMLFGIKLDDDDDGVAVGALLVLVEA